MKNEEIKNYDTEFHKDVIQQLEKLGYKNIANESIAIMTDNDSDDLSVDINFMSTGLHYSKKEVKEEDVREAGFKWCSTWNFYEK